MPPYMGQGGATAMEDAVVLARSLATADADSAGLTRAFGGYDAWSVPLAEPGVIEVGAAEPS
jgi:2-polyprenyl-6-methoxyphenol hydroxylase-like FAD-dependent oxidoreductase